MSNEKRKKCKIYLYVRVFFNKNNNTQKIQGYTFRQAVCEAPSEQVIIHCITNIGTNQGSLQLVIF